MNIELTELYQKYVSYATEMIRDCEAMRRKYGWGG